LSDGDIGPALAAEDLFTPPRFHRLPHRPSAAWLRSGPQTLALMHGSSTKRRCQDSLLELANAYELLVKRP
jgi:hypothetical protein